MVVQMLCRSRACLPLLALSLQQKLGSFRDAWACWSLGMNPPVVAQLLVQSDMDSVDRVVPSSPDHSFGSRNSARGKSHHLRRLDPCRVPRLATYLGKVFIEVDDGGATSETRNMKSASDTNRRSGTGNIWDAIRSPDAEYVSCGFAKSGILSRIVQISQAMGNCSQHGASLTDIHLVSHGDCWGQ